MEKEKLTFKSRKIETFFRLYSPTMGRRNVDSRYGIKMKKLCSSVSFADVREDFGRNMREKLTYSLKIHSATRGRI